MSLELKITALLLLALLLLTSSCSLLRSQPHQTHLCLHADTTSKSGTLTIITQPLEDTTPVKFTTGCNIAP